jgi:uncharacterized membrane protein YhaH (DUF805 family)
MGQLARYIAVYAHPFGRLPQDLFWFYGIPAAFAVHCLEVYLGGCLYREEVLSAWWLVLLITLYWMTGCVQARRLRDFGFTGSLPMAIAILLSIRAACIFFPEDLLGSSDTQGPSYLILESMYFAARWAFRFTCAGCAIKPGDSGANFYGLPLGTLNPEQQAERDAERRTRIERDSAKIVAGRAKRKEIPGAELLAQTGTTPRAPSAMAPRTLVPASPARAARASPVAATTTARSPVASRLAQATRARSSG